MKQRRVDPIFGRMIASEFYALCHDRVFGLCCLLAPPVVAALMCSSLNSTKNYVAELGWPARAYCPTVAAVCLYLVWYAALAGYVVWGRAVQERRINQPVWAGQPKWSMALARAVIFAALMLYVSIVYSAVLWFYIRSDWMTSLTAWASYLIIFMAVLGSTAPVMVLTCCVSEWRTGALFSVAYLFAVYQLGGSSDLTGILSYFPIYQLTSGAFWFEPPAVVLLDLLPSVLLIDTSVVASCAIMQKKELK